MNKKQRKNLIRIIVCAGLVILLFFIPVGGRPRFLLYMIPYLIIGYDILLKAWKGIKNRQAFDESLLMAIATVGAIVVALTNDGSYTEAIGVMLFYQIGEWFQSYAVGKSRRNISELMDIRPDYANIEEDGRLLQVDPDEVEPGSVIVVQPGEKIPIDGVILSGNSTLDTAALTGESLPRDVKEEDEVISGCINLTGILKIKTTKEFEESTVSKILELVENATSRKSRSEDFIARFARVYTPIVVISAMALAVLPPVIRLAFLQMSPMWGEWIYRALTFLVISCPCALVISIPLSFFAGIGGASNAGVLVKGSNYLEILSKTKYIVFDKTGTLTRGVFEVSAVHTSTQDTCMDDEAYGGSQAHEQKARRGKYARGVFDYNTPDQEKLLEYAALAEVASSHPISKSLRLAYGKEPDRSRVSDVQEISGHGITAVVDGRHIAVGNDKLMEKMGISCHSCHMTGTIIHVAIDREYAGHIVISDVIKEHSKDAIRRLKEAGIEKTVMLTGDIEKVADEVGRELGIDEIHSDLLPADKVIEVERLLSQKPDKSVLAFVGDGINDAPVLTRADIGIAMGAMGADAAIEAADVVLMDDDPLKISKAIRISKKCLRIVYENIWFAIGIKILCLILGALGIANMWVAVFADVGVMILAVLNAIRALFVKRL